MPHLSLIYDPFGSPHRGQMPLVEEENRLTRCSDPLSYKVGGASKPSPWLCGLGPLGNRGKSRTLKAPIKC